MKRAGRPKKALDLLADGLRLPEEKLGEAKVLITEVCSSDDPKGGQAAFQEKRKPRFVSN